MSKNVFLSNNIYYEGVLNIYLYNQVSQKSTPGKRKKGYVLIYKLFNKGDAFSEEKFN